MIATPSTRARLLAVGATAWLLLPFSCIAYWYLWLKSIPHNSDGDSISIPIVGSIFIWAIATPVFSVLTFLLTRWFVGPVGLFSQPIPRSLLFGLLSIVLLLLGLALASIPFMELPLGLVWLPALYLGAYFLLSLAAVVRNRGLGTPNQAL